MYVNFLTSVSPTLSLLKLLTQHFKFRLCFKVLGTRKKSRLIVLIFYQKSYQGLFRFSKWLVHPKGKSHRGLSGQNLKRVVYPSNVLQGEYPLGVLLWTKNEQWRNQYHLLCNKRKQRHYQKYKKKLRT